MMCNTRQPTIAHVFTVAYGLVAAASLLGLGCGVATAEDGRLAYLPMTFSAEGQDIRTTACLQVTEQVYPSSAWWEESSGDTGGPEHAFRAVIAAMKRKDRAALFALSDPAQGRDPKRFDGQAAAFFQQFDVIKLVAVPRAYVFDGLVVFFAKLQSATQTAFVPFAFAYEHDGSYGFLPYRTEQSTYQLVVNLFYPRPELATPDNPPYCSDADIKRATHRISLVSSEGSLKHAWHPSTLFLTGASFDAPGELTKLAARVTSTIEGMKAAVVTKRLNDFVKYLTPEGGKSLTKWFASTDQTGRSGYEASGYKTYDGVAVTDQQPFFVFDASPLVIVYTRSSDGTVHVICFTFNANHELLWTNYSYMSSGWDPILKMGPLYDAALLAKPFSSIAISSNPGKNETH